MRRSLTLWGWYYLFSRWSRRGSSSFRASSRMKILPCIYKLFLISKISCIERKIGCSHVSIFSARCFISCTSYHKCIIHLLSWKVIKYMFLARIHFRIGESFISFYCRSWSVTCTTFNYPLFIRGCSLSIALT